MTAITISSDAGLTTVISTFTVEPARQEELVALLANHADRLLSGQPGFAGCALHASQDGTTVVNYALWRDADVIQGMLADPAVRQHAKTVRVLPPASRPGIPSATSSRNGKNSGAPSRRHKLLVT
jgi:heme-degrading monooxygenase HmoA